MSKLRVHPVLHPPAPTGVYERADVSSLRLDARNPRLAQFGINPNSTQPEILKTLWREMAVEEVASSIAYNGYFEHEPLFVEENKSGELVVIEGNRRLAAVMLLLNAAYRKQLKATDLAAVSASAAKALQTLPVIMTTREASWRYLGFKHVNGPATWGSYAKAEYIAHVHNDYGIPLQDIAAQIGDYNATVQRMYRGLMIVEQAERDGVFSRANIAKTRFHFNYIYTGMDYPGFKSFLGLDKSAGTKINPVPTKKSKELGELLSWLYGTKGGKPSVIKSQNPDLKRLDEVLQTENGIKALRNGLPLDVAHDISLGDEKVFTQSLQNAKASLQKAYGTLPTGYQGDDSDALTLAITVEELAQELVDAMRKKRKRTSREDGARNDG